MWNVCCNFTWGPWSVPNDHKCLNQPISSSYFPLGHLQDIMNFTCMTGNHFCPTCKECFLILQVTELYRFYQSCFHLKQYPFIADKILGRLVCHFFSWVIEKFLDPSRRAPLVLVGDVWIWRHCAWSGTREVVVVVGEHNYCTDTDQGVGVELSGVTSRLVQRTGFNFTKMSKRYRQP